MGHYETVLPVRFGHVDYAGIMFYPRFFDNFHAVFEDMFGARLGTPYMSLLKERRIGFPTVRIETDFRRPFRFGDRMRMRISVERTGRSSIHFHYRGYNDGPGHADAARAGAGAEPSVEARAVVVVMHLDTFEVLPIPPDIQAVLDGLRE